MIQVIGEADQATIRGSVSDQSAARKIGGRPALADGAFGTEGSVRAGQIIPGFYRHVYSVQCTVNEISI